MKTNLFFGLFIALFSLSAAALQVGDKVPDFAAKNQSGKVIHLSDYRGKNVLVYFYPKDQTSGCTAEAQGLRDQYSQFVGANTVILGVSRQDAESHREFIKKENLPFDLLVDDDGSLAKSLGVGLMPVIGFSKRQSLLIGPDGKLVKFYGDVEPAKHASEVLTDVQTNSVKK